VNRQQTRIVDRRRLLEEAAMWFARSRSRTFGRTDQRSLETWLEARAEHRDAYAEVLASWNTAGAFRTQPEMLAMREAALRRYPASAHTRRWSRFALAAACTSAAAVAAVAIGVAILLKPPPTQIFQTGVGQTATIALMDGSQLTLDTDTVVRARMGSRRREIYLDHGRAFFKVAKDKSRPFVVVVEASHKSVTATGTAFEVTADPRRFEVLLVEGKVRVSQTSQGKGGADAKALSAELEAGTRLSSLDGGRWVLARASGADELAWMHGELVFDNKPLSEIVAEMNRYSRRKIVIGDQQVAARTIYGAFMAGDVDQFAHALADYKIARIQSESDDSVVLEAP
jgi:transmembrane sensor